MTFDIAEVDWAQEQLHVQRSEYKAHSDIRDMSELEVDEWRKANQMTVHGTDAPRPIRRFEESGLPDDIIEGLKNAGFEFPTPIQMQCWPMIMTGQDVIGVAQTGSGKTLGFMLPGLMHVRRQPQNANTSDGPVVL